MKVEGIELIAEEIDGWIQTRKIIGARKGVDKIQYIDLINDNIIRRKNNKGLSIISYKI